MQQILYSHNHNKSNRFSYVNFMIIALLFQFLLISPVKAQTVNKEITVNTSSDLQSALNSDATIIRIAPQNEENTLYLEKALIISNDRTITLTADSPTKIVGASGQWQFITSADTDVRINFNNVVLDGNNVSGGIYNRGALTLDNAVIQNCYNSNGGAGIYGVGDLTIKNSSFLNNISNPNNYCDGGAIYGRGLSSSITVNISNSKFTNNSSRYGGAVRIDNAGILVTNCEFSGNTAVQGPGIYIADNSVLNVTDSTLTKNTGSGAIFVNISNLILTDSTVSDNNGRGIYGYAEGGNVNITVNGKSLVKGNSAKTSYGGGIIGYTWGASKAVINIAGNAVISNNEALHGAGVSSYPDSDVTINISDNAQIINNTAYENGGGIYGNGIVNVSDGKINSNTAKNGGGIYGASGTLINIRDAVISENTAGQDGGGIWVNNLSDLNVNNLTFSDNKATVGYFWRINSPMDERQQEDAATHNKRVINTSYTLPYTNAYSNCDINYTTAVSLTPFTVTYNGNSNDSGLAPVDQNNPYLTNEPVTLLTISEAFLKSGYVFVGWNTKPDGTGQHYAYDNETGQFHPQTLTMGNENVILYAQWKDKSQDMGIPGQSGISPGPGTTEQLDIALELEVPEQNEIISESEILEEVNPPAPELPIILDTIPEYPPDYQLSETENNTIQVRDSGQTAIGQWVDTDDGWIYYPEPDTVQPVPMEDGSFEVNDQDDAPLGLWSKNENDDWVYEEYPPSRSINPWVAFGIGILILSGLAVLFYFFIFLRRYVTREEFVRMVTREIHLEAEIENTLPYTDVAEDDKFYDAVMSAKTIGLLPGFPESEFQPHALVTREEMSSILAETVKYVNVPISLVHIDLKDVFKDFEDINEFFIEYIQQVVQMEIILGKSDDKFDPKGLSTKRQASKIIKNLLAIISPYLPSDIENR